MTQASNRQKLFDWLAAMGSQVSEVADSVKHVPHARYPLLAVLVKERGTVTPTALAHGHDSIDSVMEKLMLGLDHYTRIKNKDAAEEQLRLERQAVRDQQVEDYEKALAIDQAKQEQIQRQRKQEMEAESSKQRAEEERQLRLTKLASSLPEEPPASDPSAITIRMRFPGGDIKTRRFAMGQPLSWLITYVESLGFSMGDFVVWTSDVPKINVGGVDSRVRSRPSGDLAGHDQVFHRA